MVIGGIMRLSVVVNDNYHAVICGMIDLYRADIT